MQLKKKLMYSGIISAATLITSILIPIVPCRVAPGVPNPIYKWTLCSLNPDKTAITRSIREYFGYTTSLTDSYILILLITFVVAMIFFHYTTRKNNLVGILTWIVGVIVALAVGSGMIDSTLSIPAIPAVITIIAGWVVVIGAILSLVLAIFNK